MPRMLSRIAYANLESGPIFRAQDLLLAAASFDFRFPFKLTLSVSLPDRVVSPAKLPSLPPRIQFAHERIHAPSPPVSMASYREFFIPLPSLNASNGVSEMARHLFPAV